MKVICPPGILCVQYLTKDEPAVTDVIEVRQANVTQPRGRSARDSGHQRRKLHEGSPFGNVPEVTDTLPPSRVTGGSSAQRVNQERIVPTVTGTVSLTSTVNRYTLRTVCTCLSG